MGFQIASYFLGVAIRRNVYHVGTTFTYTFGHVRHGMTGPTNASILVQYQMRNL